MSDQTNDDKRTLPEAGNTLCWLLDRAAPNMTRVELDALRDSCRESAEATARCAAVAASGIAGLVCEDKTAGNFRNTDDVSELLYHFAEAFERVNHLLLAAVTADYYAELHDHKA